ncbi:DUF4350 domain-containing protein [Flavobacterium sp. MK4S-17]|uniref:DUF4350 domain-containing protein n=1 Tax=Flavobacterium sp. MK4S-17 TaxID=2543737 RepID=UPI0013585189|nr:DUF4350 domain-containing protein [Flavobacterium sp. MK4S-17]
MNRKVTIYIIFLVLVLGLLIVIDSGRPKPIDWTPSYSVTDKRPLGLYIFDKESKNIFKGQPIKKISTTPYEYFDPKYDYEKKSYNVSGTFMHIAEESEIDNESAKELLYFAEHGNTVFLSMKTFPPALLDSLKFETGDSFFYKDTISLSVDNKNTDTEKYKLVEGRGIQYFTSIDTLNTIVLGHQWIDTIQQANYIKVRYGMGSFLLHTQPAAFSNFHLLKGNHYQYTEKLVSFMPKNTLFWYARHFTGEASGSPLRYILQNKALRWSLYLGLIGIIIFIIFNAKRKQRIIPEMAPVKNTTVDFTKTIGNLYYQEKNHHTIIEKKIIYFLEHIRNEYLIDTYDLDDTFVEKLHLKTGKPIAHIQHAIRLIKKYRYQFESTEEDVIEINKAIEKLRL